MLNFRYYVKGVESKCKNNMKWYAFFILGILVLFISFRYFISDMHFINNFHYKVFNPFVNFENNTEKATFSYPNSIILSDSLLSTVQATDPEKQLPKNTKSQPRVVLLLSDGYLGEINAAIRISKILTDKGVEWAIVTNKKYSLFKNRHRPVISHLNPDFVISINIENKPAIGYPNYLYLHEGDERYFHKKKRYLPHISMYQGYLVVGEQYNKLESYLRAKGNPFYHIKTTFSCAATEFTPLSYQRLFYCGGNCDKLRGGKTYRYLYNLLDKTGYLDVYGPQKAWTNLASYKGYANNNNFIETIKKSGVALVLHSESHLSQNVPTSRIFESVSASAVVICDLLPFAVENFGDAFLYVDQTKSAEEMFKQIDRHMQWIKNNPAKAQLMAKKAHDIFMEYYTLEKEVENIFNFHERIVR